MFNVKISGISFEKKFCTLFYISLINCQNSFFLMAKLNKGWEFHKKISWHFKINCSSFAFCHITNGNTKTKYGQGLESNGGARKSKWTSPELTKEKKMNSNKGIIVRICLLCIYGCNSKKNYFLQRSQIPPQPLYERTRPDIVLKIIYR